MIKEITSYEQLKALYDKNVVVWNAFIANCKEKLVGLLHYYNQDTGYIISGEVINKLLNINEYLKDDIWMIIDDSYNQNYYEGVDIVNLIDSKYINRENPFKLQNNA